MQLTQALTLAEADSKNSAIRIAAVVKYDREKFAIATTLIGLQYQLEHHFNDIVVIYDNGLACSPLRFIGRI